MLVADFRSGLHCDQGTLPMGGQSLLERRHPQRGLSSKSSTMALVILT